MIFHEGNATLAVYVTEQSSVKIFTSYKGADIVLQHLDKGNIIGGIAYQCARLAPPPPLSHHRKKIQLSPRLIDRQRPDGASATNLAETCSTDYAATLTMAKVAA